MGSMMYSIKKISQDCLGSPVVKTLPSNAGSVGSIPGEEAKIDPTCLVAKKKKHKKQNRSNMVTNSKKTLKMVHIKKINK